MWSALRTDDQLELQRRLFFLTNCVALPTIYVILYSQAAGFERIRVRRELSNGMYRPSAYALVTASIHLPTCYGFALVACIITYAWGDLHAWGAIGFSLLPLGMVVFFFLNLAHVCGWVFGELNGPLVFVAVFSVAFRARHRHARSLSPMLQCAALRVTSTRHASSPHALTYMLCLVPPHRAVSNGFFISEGQISWPWKLLTYINPLYWGEGAYVYHTFLDAPDQPGAELCDRGPDCTDGFRCEGTQTTSVCYGVNGSQILASLHKQARIHSARNEHVQYAGIMSAHRTLTDPTSQHLCGVLARSATWSAAWSATWSAMHAFATSSTAAIWNLLLPVPLRQLCDDAGWHALWCDWLRSMMLSLRRIT